MRRARTKAHVDPCAFADCLLMLSEPWLGSHSLLGRAKRHAQNRSRRIPNLLMFQSWPRVYIK